MNTKTLNFNDSIDKRLTALVGRDNGENHLKKVRKMGVDFIELEKEYDLIQIIIPDFIVSINKSYFLGFFETFIQRLGKDAFLKKYCFVTNEYISDKILRHIEAATLTASQDDILGL